MDQLNIIIKKSNNIAIKADCGSIIKICRNLYHKFNYFQSYKINDFINYNKLTLSKFLFFSIKRH